MWWIIVLVFLLLVVLYDLFQRKESVARVFPLIYRFRKIGYFLRPMVYQYFIESPTGGKPASHLDREFVDEASRGVVSDIGFGTEQDYHKPGKIHIKHSPWRIKKSVPIRLKPLVVGGQNLERIPGFQPMFLDGRIGVGDMSIGSISPAAGSALSTGARDADITISTGEGGLTDYHRRGVYLKVTPPELASWAIAQTFARFSDKWIRTPMPRSRHLGGGQIIFEAGTGMFGVRTLDGEFDFNKLAEIMADPQVGAFKIKWDQGAKPGGGALLPGIKVTKEIAAIRGVRPGVDCESPNSWDDRLFKDMPGFMAFVEKCKQVGKKPVGIKFTVSRPEWVEEMAIWMKEHPGEGPDFLHIDGGEGGSGATPLMMADFVGMPILHAIPLVDNIFRKHGVRDRIIIMSSGKVFNPGHLFIQLSLGSDFCFLARAFMFTLGCIQAKRCHLGDCPSGVATMNKWLQRALVARVKWKRVRNYSNVMHGQLVTLLRVVGKKDTYELTRDDISIVVGAMNEISMAQHKPYPPGCDAPRLPPIAETYGLRVPARFRRSRHARGDYSIIV